MVPCPNTERFDMNRFDSNNHNKIAADEFCNKTHTSPIEAYVANRIYELETQVNRLKQERDEARREICERIQMIDPNDECWTRLNPQQIAEHRGWDCYKKPYCFRVNGVVVSKGKAVPPKFELGEDDK
jgi:hypothetical protein